MKGKKLVLLVIGTVIVVAAAVLVSKDTRRKAPEFLGSKVLPALTAEGEELIYDVARVVVTDADGMTTLSQTDGTWGVEEKNGYPVDVKKLADALKTLEDMTIKGVVSVDAEQRRQLKMFAPQQDKAGTDAGTAVSLQNADGKELAGLLIGEAHERKASGPSAQFGGGYPDGKYVSPDNGATVYFVSDLLSEFSADAKNWVNGELANVAAAKVKSVEIKHADGAVVTLEREKEGSSLAMPGLADDEELDTSKLYSLESAFSYLRLDDIADRTLSDEALGMDTPTVCTLKTFDNRVYTATVGGSPEGSSGRYVRLNARLLPEEEADVETKADDATDDTSESNSSESSERADAQKQVDELNARAAGWTYVISSYKAEGMTRQRSDLVKKKEKQDEETDAASADDSDT